MENKNQLVPERPLLPAPPTAEHREAAVIDRILELRNALDLPTDEHTVAFLVAATREEIHEILAGVEELAKIYAVSGRRTFATVLAA